MQNIFKKKAKALESTDSEPISGKLGTFGGVFTPSILTILGVIMYLRFGWVVGNVGLVGTLLIVVLATSITFLTALSVSAIATDQRVRIGGAYYMISRSLGVEVGGAVGIPLFIALALSVALYTVGFAESVAGVFPGVDFKMAGIITTIGVGILALISAKFAIRAQYFIMLGIILSLLSLFFGKPIEETEIEMWGAASEDSENFWVVFAVFFPAVTGIMAGVNMSGDLKDPAKSIPRGTFAAIGTGFLIYMTLPVILAMRVDAETLIADPLIMRQISYWGDAILIGVWGATLSSAIGSMLGGPRVLQALALDGVLPKWLRWLGWGSGKNDTPRAGTIFTMLLALVAVYLGNLNVIAPILTMFFLTTYGVLNAAAGIERLLDSPSFRPEFKVHWVFSIIGAIGCLIVMFLIHPLATVLAFVFVVTIFVWLKRRQLETAWGDVSKGLYMALIRTGLMRLRQEAELKTWRPHPLVLTGAPAKRWHLIELASAFTLNRGILTIATILPEDKVSNDRIISMESKIRDFLDKRSVQALVRVTTGSNPYTGAEELVKSYGLGYLVPNTIILGDSETLETRHLYCRMIAKFYEQQRNVVIVHDVGDIVFREKKKIDLWWGGLKGNGALMMILAYILQNNQSWLNAEITIKMVVQNKQAAESAHVNLERIIKKLRLGAKTEIIVADGRSFDTILHTSSKYSDLIFMGMATPDDNFLDYYNSIQERLKNLPTTIMVLAGEKVSFDDVLIQSDSMDT